MAKIINFEEINSHGAGIDIGSREIFVSIDGEQVVRFQTFTADYRLCCKYLKEHGIESVAMEATGVYWMSLYSMLEEFGIKVCLVHKVVEKKFLIDFNCLASHLSITFF